MSCHIVTLATAGTTYRLDELIALHDMEPDPSLTIRTVAREIRVQAHPDNAGKIFGGEDNLVSLLRYGYILTATSGPRIYNIADLSTATTTKKFVADTNDQKLLVELIP